MARSPLLFAVNLKLSTGGRVYTGLGHLVDTLGDANLVTAPMSETLSNLAEIAQREAVSASGSQGVARTVLTEIEPTLARVRVPLAYAPTLNRGRAKGAKMPSPNDPELRAWASAHGWEGKLFMLARAIQRRGRKGRFFMRKARAAVRRAMPDQVERMEQEIERRFSA